MYSLNKIIIIQHFVYQSYGEYNFNTTDPKKNIRNIVIWNHINEDKQICNIFYHKPFRKRQYWQKSEFNDI